MRLHPVELTVNAEAEVIEVRPDPDDQDALLMWIESQLERLPRFHTRLPGLTPPTYVMRDGGVAVIYQVGDVDPVVENEEADDAPGATVTVLNVWPSRGEDLNRLVRRLQKR